jgi:hypothetical protein
MAARRPRQLRRRGRCPRPLSRWLAATATPVGSVSRHYPPVRLAPSASVGLGQCVPPQPPLPNSARAPSKRSPPRKSGRELHHVRDLAGELDCEASLGRGDRDALDQPAEDLEHIALGRGVGECVLQVGEPLPVDLGKIGMMPRRGRGCPRDIRLKRRLALLELVELGLQARSRAARRQSPRRARRAYAGSRRARVASTSPTAPRRDADSSSARLCFRICGALAHFRDGDVVLGLGDARRAERLNDCRNGQRDGAEI